MTFVFQTTGAAILSETKDLKILGALICNNAGAAGTYEISFSAETRFEAMPAGQVLSGTVAQAPQYYGNISANSTQWIPLKATLKKGTPIYVLNPAGAGGDTVSIITEDS